MPSRDVHNLVCKLCGIDKRTADRINKMIDAPYKTLGPRHRRLFHSPQQIIALSIIKKDPRILQVGLLHILTDKLKSKR